MYVANVRAQAPVVIGFPATSVVGSLIDTGRPAFLASAAIAVLFMSGVPTIASCLRLSRTVLRPLTPMTIATAPNTISTIAATAPPYSNHLRISTPFLAAKSPARPDAHTIDRDRLGAIRPTTEPGCGNPAGWLRLAGGEDPAVEQRRQGVGGDYGQPGHVPCCYTGRVVRERGRGAGGHAEALTRSEEQ